MKRYACLNRQRLAHDAYAIQPVQASHTEAIRQWRNAQMAVLRQKTEISATDQQDYYSVHVWPEMDAEQPAKILISLLFQDRAIGYGGLVNVDWKHRRAEVSFLLSPERAENMDDYAMDFSTFLLLVKKMAFEDLGLRRLYTETFDIRPHHIALLEAAGFRREGVMRAHEIIDGRPVDSIMHGVLDTDEE
jgi:RimJ/RimL family protein N-acetyltransferase